jgi:hypothetical protein
MRVVRQRTVLRAEVTFVTIQRENIRLSKKEIRRLLQCLNCPMFVLQLGYESQQPYICEISIIFSFPFPFVPLQRRGCLVAPLFL